LAAASRDGAKLLIAPWMKSGPLLSIGGRARAYHAFSGLPQFADVVKRDEGVHHVPPV
jgi:hypothetical protein